jgi:pullulanase/glycogen debranching enzyme
MAVSQAIGTKPIRAQKDDIIYEVNVRGLTKNDSGVPIALRGTYAGAALKALYLANLGATAVEFQPVQETQNGSNDNTPNSTAGQNYWGYSTLNYFAPDRRSTSSVQFLSVTGLHIPKNSNGARDETIITCLWAALISLL